MCHNVPCLPDIVFRYYLQDEGAYVSHAVGEDDGARQCHKDDEDSLVECHRHNVPVSVYTFMIVRVSPCVNITLRYMFVLYENGDVGFKIIKLPLQ